MRKDLAFLTEVSSVKDVLRVLRRRIMVSYPVVNNAGASLQCSCSAQLVLSFAHPLPAPGFVPVCLCMTLSLSLSRSPPPQRR